MDAGNGTGTALWIILNSLRVVNEAAIAEDHCVSLARSCCHFDSLDVIV